jgi:hypothetical protein
MGRVAETGDGSTLSLDFTTMGGTLDSRITFSRADATALATFINSSGIVTTVSTAQAPRFDFDPTTLVAKGLLIEAAATNSARYSEDCGNSANGWWTLGGAGSSLNSQTKTSPANTSTASEINLGTSTNGRTYVYVATTAVAYTGSIYLRLVSGNPAINLRVFNNTTGITTLTPITVTSTWARYSVSFTGGAVNVEFGIQSPHATAVVVDVWGSQVETGSRASSYIKTIAPVTRAVDTAIIAAGTNFSSWYTGGTTGTFIANWYGSASSTTARTVIATSDQITKHLHMYQTPSALTLRLADFNAAATVTTANSLTAGALAKGAFSYNGTATSLCLNGGTVATGTLAFTVAPTWLSIGGPSTNGTSITNTTVMLDNSIRTLKYFPTRLSDAQIQTLTTP